MSIVNEQEIFDFFKVNNIKYKLFEHQPVFTIEDKPVVTAIDRVPALSGEVPKPHFKTLFLKDKKNNKFFLISVIEDKRVDFRLLSDALGCGRLSFGDSSELLKLIKLQPGSVTPYGLMFDQIGEVIFILDQDAMNYQFVYFHPMRNDMTVATTTHDFLICMEKLNHKARICSIPVK